MRNRLGIWILLSVMTLLSGCTLWREHEVRGWGDATGGEGLEKSFWKEIKGGNMTELEGHLAGNFVAFTPQEGRMDRAAFLEHMKPLKLDDYFLGDMQTELNSDTFVVTYTITMRGTYNGQPLPAGPIRMMTVWQHQKRNWVAIAHSVLVPST